MNFWGIWGFLETCSYLTGNHCSTTLIKALLFCWYHCGGWGGDVEAGTQTKICKIIEKRFKYLIYFLHFKPIYVQFQWEINVFLLLLSCFSVLLNTSPSFPLCVSQVYPGGGCSEPELSHQSKHKCMSCGPEATWFSLCLFISLSASTSVFHVFLAHLLLLFHLVLKMERKWIMCGFQRPTVTAGLFIFIFFTASELISKTNFKNQK